jgi:hypothetical protein
MNIRRTARMSRPVAVLAVTLACTFLTLGEDGRAGIQGSGVRRQAVAVGQITRFGSIYVNGVEYHTSGANIRVDDEPASESRLRIGQVVTVRAEINEDGTAGEASEVSFNSNVLGPIAQVDLAGGTLIVLGQKIRLLGDTLLGESLPLGGILGLVPGIKVQVSGFPNASGELEATRIDLVLGGPSNARLKGVVQSLNTTARTFRINSQTVSYSASAVPATLADGDTVAVLGSVPLGQSTLQAIDVEVVSGSGGAPDEVGNISGLVTVFTSASDFMLGAQRVVADANTRFVLHGKVLGPNLPVEVEGVFNSAGDLVASRVEANATGLVGARGVVEAVSPANGELRVQGVSFSATAETAFDDISSQAVRPFALSDVQVGDYMEVRGGALEPNGPLVATTIKRQNARDDYYVEGVARSVFAPNLNVLGVRVITTPQTRYPAGGLLAALKFFLEAPNKTVRIHGTVAGGTLVAERVEIVK